MEGIVLVIIVRVVDDSKEGVNVCEVTSTNKGDQDGTVEENNYGLCDGDWVVGVRVVGILVFGVSVDSCGIKFCNNDTAVGLNVGEMVVGNTVVGGIDGDEVGDGVVGILVGRFVGDLVGLGHSSTSITNESTPWLTIFFSHEKALGLVKN